MKSPKSTYKGFTFIVDLDLFGEVVIMLFRNSDKKHIISITREHVFEMEKQNLDIDDHADILKYIKKNHSHLL